MSHHGGRAFHGSGHGKQKKEKAEKEKVELVEDEEEEEDPFDTRIKKSGCADLHYALLVSLAFLDREVQFNAKAYMYIYLSLINHYVHEYIH